MTYGIAQRIAVVLALTIIPASVLSAQTPPPTPPPVVTTPTQATAAQAAAQQTTGRAVTNQQISDAIRQSGMNQSQIQAQLRSRGLDPGLADPFFRAGGAGAVGGLGAIGSGAANSSFAQALQALGILTSPQDSADATPAGREPAGLDTTAGLVGRAGDPNVRISAVFGKDVFNRAATVFDPVTSGPVDPAYRLGLGDELQLVVTGQVEVAHRLDVRRDGTVIIPQVGQIPVAGLTIDAARTVLRERMARSYSGVESGAARVDLSLTRVRANAVFVIGEVEQPGSYLVNALGTVFHALARAGGPTERGSFRAIEVRRGGRVIQRLDLYDYLLRGDATGDVRLEQGDQIFVPLNTRAVAMTGHVRRANIFELREAEGFADLIRFAGGLAASASTDRVQIDRILPSEQRRPGFERVKVDVEISGSVDSLSRVPLRDGDIVQVFSISDVRRNIVNIVGEVFQPGEYEIRPGMTLGRLIEEAQGMLPWGMADRIKIVRQLPMTGRSVIHDVDASRPAGLAFPVEEFDVVTVLDARTSFPAGRIVVEGAVNAATTRPFSERETLRDAIERSGGLREGAIRVDLYRKRRGDAYSDTTSIRFTFPLSPTFARDSSLREFVLERDDHIVVIATPGIRDQKFVYLRGEFRHTGTYAITENVDRISDVVRRAGETLPGAYPASFHLTRNGRDVMVDFARAMRGDQLHDLQLFNEDIMVIGKDPKTVLVTGAVGRASLIRFERGRSAKDYIELAGGPAENGDAGRAVVERPSGISERVRKVALFFHTSPEVVSGATIIVPLKPERTPSSEIWARVLGTTTALASLVLAYAAVSK